MITLKRRGRVWWAESNLAGERKRWSLRTRDRQIALALLRAAQLQILGEGHLTEKRWEDFQKEFEDWIAPQVAPHTLKEYRRVLKLFAQFLAQHNAVHLAEISERVLALFAECRTHAVHRVNHRPVGSGGIRFEQRVLHRVFAYAVKESYMARNPVAARNRNAIPGKTLPFRDDEVRKMTTSPYLANKPYLHAVVLLFLHTGLRLSDVVYLRRDSIHNGILHIRTRKRGTIVRIELHAKVRAALAAVPARPESPYVFTTASGKPIVSLDKHLRRLWKFCGIEGGHAHRFRDTFAVNILHAGGTLYDVAKLLGISHRTAELYYTPYVKELQERGAKLVRSLSYSAGA